MADAWQMCQKQGHPQVPLLVSGSPDGVPMTMTGDYLL
jgi:hypothetical protein